MCNPFELPSVLLSERVELPRLPGVYFVLNSSQLLYIGRSECIRSRWITHGEIHTLKRINGEVRISWLTYPVEKILDRVALQLIEQALILKFQPPLNRQGKQCAIIFRRYR